jgi:hypothetical protein
MLIHRSGKSQIYRAFASFALSGSGSGQQGVVLASVCRKASDLVV